MIKGDRFERAMVRAFVSVIEGREEKHDPIARKAWPEMSDAARAWRRIRSNKRGLSMADAYSMSEALGLDFSAFTWDVLQQIKKTDAEYFRGYGVLKEEPSFAQTLVAEEQAAYGKPLRGRIMLNGAKVVRLGASLDLDSVPDAADYLAVPLVGMDAAAKPGPVPSEEIQGWLLVKPVPQPGRDIVAVLVEDEAMSPTLGPGDIVFVDRSRRDPTSTDGGIWLMRLGGRRAALRRVRFSSNESNLIIYGDNQNSVQPDLFDRSISQEIVGAVLIDWGKAL